MAGIGLWRATGDAPQRLHAADAISERQLEDWIEQDPQLLEHGLKIVARQLRTAGGPLDLLGIDAQGRWVLIEIKKDRLRREALSQAIDYASCLVAMDSDVIFKQCDEYLSRRSMGNVAELLRACGVSTHESDGLEPVIYLVGTRIDPGLERMIEYLSKRGNFSVRLVTFSVFAGHSGDVLITREIHETEWHAAPSVATKAAGLPTLEELQAMADEHNAGAIWRRLVTAGERAGLYPRRYKKSVMLTPPQNKTRCAIYLPTQHRRTDGSTHAYVAPDVFEEFLDIPTRRVVETLGQEWIEIDHGTVDRFCDGLAQLMSDQEPSAAQ